MFECLKQSVGRAGLPVAILEKGIDPGVMMLSRAVLGGIKARSFGPLFPRWDGEVGSVPAENGLQVVHNGASTDAAFDSKAGSARVTVTMAGVTRGTLVPGT